jgi:hypothetical protein
VATDLYRDVAGRAKEQGLSADDAKEFAGQVGEKFKTALANVTGESEQAGPEENSPITTAGSAG